VNAPVLTPHSALVYLMVAVASADARMTDEEIGAMSHGVADLPAFKGYDRAWLVSAVRACNTMLREKDGLETVLGLVYAALPGSVSDTAYALASNMAVSDGNVGQRESRLLEMIRHDLGIERLTAAAIDRAVVALNRSLPA